MKSIPRDATIVVAMSGGVDSSVAAALLSEKGYQVIGITMKLWEFQEVGGNASRATTCCSIETMNDARAVCQTLGVPHYVIDFQDEFKKHVINNFIDEYLCGRTPNPCILCNSKIKWESLLQKARELGADYLATGHYARITRNDQTGRWELRRGLYAEKDQSYALWGLSQESLSHTLFPLGELTKQQVREIARKLNLRTADKSESQEICFVPDNDYRRLLREKAPEYFNGRLQKGKILSTDGQLLGYHDGYPNFTIGQRKGLGIALGKPVYVVDIDPKENTIVVGTRDELVSRGLIASQVNWVSEANVHPDAEYFVKIRYRDRGALCKAEELPGGKLKITFLQPQGAVTPGQSAVLYDGDRVILGGIIEKGIKEPM